MAQLVERSLSIPEVRGSTPVISKIYIEHLFVKLFIINCIEKTKINKKRQGIAQFFKKLNWLQPDGAVHIHKNMNWSQVRFLTKTTNTEESFPKECRCLHCFDGKRILFKKLSNTFLA